MCHETIFLLCVGIACETASSAGTNLCLSQAAVLTVCCCGQCLGLLCAPGWSTGLLQRDAATVYEDFQNAFQRVLHRRLAKNEAVKQERKLFWFINGQHWGECARQGKCGLH